MLYAETTHQVTFSNSAWDTVKPAGTVIEIREGVWEAPNRCVYVRLPGTRYSAIVPRSLIQPV